MGILSLPQLLLFQLILNLLLSFSVSWAGSDSAPDQDFVQCLLSHSQPSHPISEAIYIPNNASYASVLRSYIRNLRFNTCSTPKPFLIITPLHESHVQQAIVCAQKQNLLMKIRSGGHDYEGVSYVSDLPFFLLDMFNLRSIDIDINSETAWVQAGATLGELFYRIYEKSKIHGFPAGVCPTVGVGGHFSGAGYGNLMRKYGLSADNIIDAQLMDVHGRLLDRKSMGEDLFWAITGGGGASFGVVIAYKINLVRVPQTVTVFRVERTLEQNATDIVYRWQYVAPKLDTDLFIRLTMEVVNITGGPLSTGGENYKTIRASFIGFFLGNSERLLSVMETGFPELSLKQSDCIEMSWVESVLFWTSFPIGTEPEALLSRKPQVLVHLKRKSDYVKTPIPKIGLMWIWQKMIEFEVPIMSFNPYGGKMSEIPESATPCPHRAGNLWKIQEAYFNYKDLDLGINNNGKASYFEGRAYGIRYFKDNFDRLVRIKTEVDPGNFFRNEQSIPTLP
ncbi:hypothetical protein L3X38_003015 [Prunus dulcis]|uniref:FAD-binding PCMH-type domain-containing protein n=1 Tax=Prunus dulcis TaxID=3755 RepID=A0AAD4ZL92_PRUDU|nr:hypothetical protein L3X38_003015 [Prunus dulcis]